MLGRRPLTTVGRKFPPEALSEVEARRLVLAPSGRAPTGVRNRALMAVMYGSGLRCAEALALKPSDVDLESGWVRVLHGKGDASRTVGIDGGCIVHVVRWVETRRALGVPSRGRRLFCTLSGGPVDPRYVRAMVARYGVRAGIEKRVHPHGLRHTYAVELERSGFTVSEIQRLLGHKSLDTTATYLDHVSPSDLIEKVRNRRSVL